MTSHIHPADKADALREAVKQMRNRSSSEAVTDPLDRNRLHILEALAREAELEARR